MTGVLVVNVHNIEGARSFSVLVCEEGEQQLDVTSG